MLKNKKKYEKNYLEKMGNYAEDLKEFETK